MVIQAGAEGVRRKRGRRHRRPWVKRIALALVGVFAALLLVIIVFSVVNPPFTAVMIGQKLAGRTLKRLWVPLEDISPHLPLAVIASEDGRFCEHWGVDWGAVKDAITEVRSNRGDLRGASTIPMQTAKNLFLWSERSYVRKAIEMPLAYLMSLFWSKQRMMEIYLNIVEWGPSVFGAQAASRYHFGKSAAQLTRREAALLAATLPNPHRRKAGRPSPRTQRVARTIERRMPKATSRAACVRLKH